MGLEGASTSRWGGATVAPWLQPQETSGDEAGWEGAEPCVPTSKPSRLRPGAPDTPARCFQNIPEP